jgi:hypothetical protein
MKNYIKYTFEFPTASAQRKKEILKDFYIAKREWLDPSAIMHLGHLFGIKAKLFKKTNPSSVLNLYGQTLNCDSDEEVRLMVYVNDNHYDLLFPISTDSNSSSDKSSSDEELKSDISEEDDIISPLLANLTDGQQTHINQLNDAGDIVDWWDDNMALFDEGLQQTYSTSIAKLTEKYDADRISGEFKVALLKLFK